MHFFTSQDSQPSDVDKETEQFTTLRLLINNKICVNQLLDILELKRSQYYFHIFSLILFSHNPSIFCSVILSGFTSRHHVYSTVGWISILCLTRYVFHVMYFYLLKKNIVIFFDILSITGTTTFSPSNL